MLKKWQDSLDMDYPDRKPFTDNTNAAIKKQLRWIRGSMRLMTGGIVTDAEREARKQRIMARPL